MKDVRIALGQVNCLAGDLEANLAKHREFALLAAGQGAQIICFPESSLTGYPKYEDESMRDHAQPLDGALGRAMADLSQETGLVVMAGLIETGDGCFYNSQLVAAEGRILGVYRKTHIADIEAVFSPREINCLFLPINRSTTESKSATTTIFPSRLAAWHCAEQR